LGRFRRDDGQDLLEYALVLPLLLLLLLGIMEFGMVVLSYDTIANAAREGARCGIIPSNEIDQCIQNSIDRWATGLNLTSDNFTVTLGGNTIRVEVTYDHNLISGPIIEAVGGDPTLQLRTVTTMQIE